MFRKIMNGRKWILIVAVSSLILACRPTTSWNVSEPTNEVVLSSEIKWEALNPARGDKSPQAGTVWGDRNGTVPTGFLVKFVDGFSSPPHIHNVSYRALVIKGLVHNDDPDAAEMWMSEGSFWTQPAGEVHITSAKGTENIAFVEIDQGPYLVKPIQEAFDNGERPVNVDKSNMVWLDASQTSLISTKGKSSPEQGPKIAFLWEKGNFQGNLIHLPAGFTGEIRSKGDVFRGVIVSGEVNYSMPKSAEIQSLDQTSSFYSTGRSVHQISTQPGIETRIYIQTNGDFQIVDTRG